MSTLCTPIGLEAQHTCQQGVPSESVATAGRSASDAYKAYVRSNGKNASWVANVMAQDGMGNGIQPEQGTDWGQVNPILKLKG